MNFAVQLPTDRSDAPDEFLSAAAVAEMARCAEDAGFDSIFVTDHPAPPAKWLRSGGHQTLDPFVALAFAAAATERIRLQTHVLIVPYRNPFLIAKAFASLDVLSGGRTIAGVAAGYLRKEFAALGADLETRNETMDDHLRALKKIWAGGPVDIDGADYQARSIEPLPLPVQRPHPPLWIGGNSKSAIRRAVELGDAWVPFANRAAVASHQRTPSLETLDELGERLDYAREHARAVGRSAPLDVVFLPVELTERERARDLAAYRESAAALGELGVTWMPIGPRAGTRERYCDWVRGFGDEVIAKLG